MHSQALPSFSLLAIWEVHCKWWKLDGIWERGYAQMVYFLASYPGFQSHFHLRRKTGRVRLVCVGFEFASTPTASLRRFIREMVWTVTSLKLRVSFRIVNCLSLESSSFPAYVLTRIWSGEQSTALSPFDPIPVTRVSFRNWSQNLEQETWIRC